MSLRPHVTLLEGRYRLISGVLFANVMFLALQLQFEGSRAGYELGFYGTKTPGDREWPQIQQGLMVVEVIFTVARKHGFEGLGEACSSRKTIAKPCETMRKRREMTTSSR